MPPPPGRTMLLIDEVPAVCPLVPSFLLTPFSPPLPGESWGPRQSVSCWMQLSQPCLFFPMLFAKEALAGAHTVGFVPEGEAV